MTEKRCENCEHYKGECRNLLSPYAYEDVSAEDVCEEWRSNGEEE